MLRLEVAAINRLAKKLGGKVYRHYSGRAMFGKHCPGVVYNMAKHGDAKFPRSLGKPAFDSLGLDSIVYFPSVNDPRPGEGKAGQS